MLSKTSAHDALIDSIGPDLIRQQFGLTSQRLYAWRQRGIPYSHRGAVAQLATLHGKPVPSDFLAPPQEKAA